MILRRLGLSEKILHNYCLNEHDSEVQWLMDKITRLNYERQFEEASSLIAKLGILPEFSVGINHQFILYVRIPAIDDIEQRRDEINKA